MHVQPNFEPPIPLAAAESGPRTSSQKLLTAEEVADQLGVRREVGVGSGAGGRNPSCEARAVPTVSARSDRSLARGPRAAYLVPFFGETSITRIEVADIERLMARLRKKGLAPKTIKNVLGSLHSVYDYALAKRWVAENPCRLVDKPVTEDSDPDIRFLALDELDAVLRAIPDRNARGKLTWDQVCSIRASSESNLAIARGLRVSDSLVSRIRRGLIWTDEASTENIYAEIAARRSSRRR
jgi:hypothetical protein